MTPERISLLRDFAKKQRPIDGDMLDCLDEIENYRRSLEQVNRTVIFQGEEIKRLRKTSTEMRAWAQERNLMELYPSLWWSYDELIRKIERGPR